MSEAVAAAVVATATATPAAEEPKAEEPKVEEPKAVVKAEAPANADEIVQQVEVSTLPCLAHVLEHTLFCFYQQSLRL